MFRRAQPDGHPTKPLVDAYIASLPKAISDEAVVNLISFQEHAMRVLGEFLDESMHDIIDVFQTVGRRPELIRYVMETQGGGMLLCGMTADHEVNASAQPAGDGFVILITDRLVVLINELAHVHAAVTRFAAGDGTVMEPMMSHEQVHQRIGQLLAWVRDGKPLPIVDPWGLDEDRTFFAEVIYDETLGFVLAHELAHVLLGHLEDRTKEFREFVHAVPEATTNGILAVDEIEADALAARLCARRTTQLGRGTHHLGGLFFFQINYLLEVAANAGRNESFRQAVRRMQARAKLTHPHPFRRLDLAIRAATQDDPGPLELCDGALLTFDEIWHGPRPARSAAALDNLERIGVGLDPDPLNAMFGFKKHGMRILAPNDIRDLLERDGEAGAIAWVSLAALSYLSEVGLQRRCVSGERQLRLYTLFGSFHVLYLNVPHPSAEAIALEADVRAAIPELDTILETYAQVIG